MRKIFLFLSFFYYFVNCTTQSLKNKYVQEETVEKQYFAGRWKMAKYILKYKNRDEKQKLPDCNSKSYWEFTIDKNILMHSHYTFNGQKCTDFTYTNPGKANIKGNNLVYSTSDILQSAKYLIINNENFTLYIEDFVGKCPVIIEKQYTRLK